MNSAVSMAKTLALSSSEILINKALHFDPATIQALGALNGKVISVCGRTPSFSLHILPCENGISLFSIYEEGSDVSLRGSTFDLLQLLRRKALSLTESSVEVDGDQAMAEEMLGIARDLDIDWEEMLSQFIGDIAAHEVGRQGRRFFRWTKKVHQSMLRNTREYLLYESHIAVSEQEVKGFGAEVKQLDDEVAELEGRIEALTKNVPPSND